MNARKHGAERCYYGAYVGIVKQLDSTSAESKKEERVQVVFPWFDDDTIFSARVSSMYSGSDYGAVWTPEEGTEVVVVFENGDLRSPFIVGCLFNGVDKTPARRKDGSDRKMVRTKGGHQLVFEDGPNERWVELSSKDGHRVRIDDTGSKLDVSFKGGAAITLTSSELKITAQNVTIEASSVVKVTAPTITLN